MRPERHIARILAIPLLLALCPPLGASPAEAEGETSSWSFNSNGVRKKTKSLPQPSSNTSINKSTGKSTGASPLIAGYKLPVAGPKAARIAFDQGQFLTAAKLAKAAYDRDKDGQAATLLGDLSADGLGIARDPVMAARWYRAAADTGDPEGSFKLAMAFIAGDGVKKNSEEAAIWFEKAARTGHVLANYNLGLQFLSGQGKPENPIRAVMHIRYAAENQIAAAQYDLATLYQRGFGVEADAYLASTWLKRAAEQGMPEAQFDYALALLRGQGINADVHNAAAYLLQAAEKGVAPAQNRLANMLASGALVKKNLMAAAKWRILAKQAGIKDDALDATLAKLPKKERQQAEAAAALWRENVTGGLSK